MAATSTIRDRGIWMRVGILRPLRFPDFRNLWIGMTTSLVGDGMFLIAVAWESFHFSRSYGTLAIAAVAMTLPQLVLQLPAGAVADRLERRNIMICSDVVRAAAVAGLGTLAVAGVLEVWMMLALLAIYGSATAFFGPAFDAVVPSLVPADELPTANALDQFVRPAALRLMGPAVGGIVVGAAGPGMAFLLDALTFAVSCGYLLRIGHTGKAILSKGRTVSGADTTTTWREVRAGFAFVRNNAWLWGTLVCATVAYLLFMGPLEVLLPYVVAHKLQASAGLLGTVYAVGGIGAVLAALAMGQHGHPRRNMLWVCLSWSAATVGIAFFGIATESWQLMVGSFVFFSLETVGAIVWATVKQHNVPGELLGRISSFEWFIASGLVPLSFALTVPVADAIGAQTTLLVAGLIASVITFAFLFLPGMRAPERRSNIGPGHELAARSS